VNIDLSRQQFIATFDGAFSDEFCDGVVSFMDRAITCGAAFTRQETENVSSAKKDDIAVFSNDVLGGYKTDALWVAWPSIMKPIVEKFWGEIYPRYASVYGILQEATAPFAMEDMKVQRTDIGGGYHVWHYEAGTKALCARNLAWTLYLNDVEEGGETEFLYQSMRVKPKKGTFVLWPAGFTHTHRGNPPISNVKYIVTGWTYLK